MQVRLQNQGGGNLTTTDNWRIIGAFLLNQTACVCVCVCVVCEFHTSYIVSYCIVSHAPYVRESDLRQLVD